jgi:hypothetical protein
LEIVAKNAHFLPLLVEVLRNAYVKAKEDEQT